MRKQVKRHIWFHKFSQTSDALSLLKWSSSVVSDSATPGSQGPTRLLHPWDSPGRNTGMGCHFFLQKIFPTQGSNLGLPYCRQTLYHLSHQGSPSSLLRIMFILAGISRHLDSTFYFSSFWRVWLLFWSPCIFQYYISLPKNWLSWYLVTVEEE